MHSCTSSTYKNRKRLISLPITFKPRSKKKWRSFVPINFRSPVKIRWNYQRRFSLCIFFRFRSNPAMEAGVSLCISWPSSSFHRKLKTVLMVCNFSTIESLGRPCSIETFTTVPRLLRFACRHDFLDALHNLVLCRFSWTTWCSFLVSNSIFRPGIAFNPKIFLTLWLWSRDIWTILLLPCCLRLPLVQTVLLSSNSCLLTEFQSLSIQRTRTWRQDSAGCGRWGEK